jgi:hypothetical protein
MVKRLWAASFAAALSIVPVAASAQSAIAGAVRDTSGAVLPGVTVEAASDALIERSRTVTTDGAGQFKIVDLRPGVYTVTFTLTGFQTVKRQAVELLTDFTATINAEMRVGALEESVTVQASSPIVDVQNASHMQVLNRDAMDAIPTGRTIQGLGQLIVGVNLSLPDTGGARGMQQTYMSTHGQSAANNTVLVDGMMVNGLMSDGELRDFVVPAAKQHRARPDHRACCTDALVGTGTTKPRNARRTTKKIAFMSDTAWQPSRAPGSCAHPRSQAGS